MRENTQIINSQHEYSMNKTDPEMYHNIVYSFQNGQDEKAISLWKQSSYNPLPVSDPSKFYILALKLKDMHILDLENTEQHNQVKDREIADENEKLKVEIHNLGQAIDSIMRENDHKKQRKSDNPGVSHTKFIQLEQDLKLLESKLNQKNDKIKDLEHQLWNEKALHAQGYSENRFTAKEDNPYRNKSPE